MNIVKKKLFLASPKSK